MHYSLRLRIPLATLGLLLAMVVVTRGAETVVVETPRCLDDLKKLSPCQLAELFAHAEVGAPLNGEARGRLLCVVDERFPRLKVATSNALWRGKSASADDGYFINRWIMGIRAIDSHYVIGPSWIDDKPAIVMEYPPGTKIFGNTRDELREIAPGLYVGPLFDRCPCPKLRGWIGVQVQCR